MPPFSIDPEKHTICDVIHRWAVIQPDAPALIQEGKTALTYSALVEAMEDIRATLNASGLGRGDRIAVVHSGGTDMASLMLGIISGATAAPLDPRHTAAEFAVDFRDRNVNALIVECDASPFAVLAAQRFGIPIMETRARKINGADWTGIDPLSPNKAAHPSLSEADDTALLLATSGTTDRSRIVPRSHRCLLAQAAVEEKATELGPDDVGIVMRPLYYSGPFVSIISAVYTGGSVAVMAKFAAPAFFDTLRKSGVTWSSGGPTFQRAIYAHAMEHPEIVGDTRLKQIRVGSAPLDSELADGLERILSTCVSTSYASTEAGRIAFSCPSMGPRRKGTVGVSVECLGFQGAKVRIRSLDGAFLPVGTRGEVVVRGPQVFEGYENDEAANAAAFVDGWFRTGDEGFFDGDGYLTLTGRIKEMINRGGEKVSPAEVDAALMGHPDVREAVTFPIPHPTLGEEVAAAVVQEPKASLTDQALTNYLLQKLTGFKVPRRFYFVKDIPKTEIGKVQRYRLAAALDVAKNSDGDTLLTDDPGRTPSPLEARLQGLWGTALRLPRVGLHDNFFLLGGDSLQAVELFFEIEKELGCRLPRAALFEAGTVAEMAALIEADTPPSCLVAIQPRGTWPPFFCIHDGNGHVLNFRDLAHELGEDIPFYGVQSVGLNGKGMPFTRIDDMAAHYVREIKKVQPMGPYFIGGYSFGGRVAYVMAQEFQKQGDEVAMLALLDTSTKIGRIPMNADGWFRRNLSRLHGLGASEIPDYVIMRFQNISVEIRRITMTRLYMLALSYYETRTKPIPRWLFRPVEANDVIRRTTRLEPYEGDAFLFQTAESANQNKDGKNGWDDLIKGRLEVVPVPGQHYQIVKEPHVRTLAAALKGNMTQRQTQPTARLDN